MPSQLLTGDAPGRGHRVIVIGHRGTAGYRPEHTLASYDLAAHYQVTADPNAYGRAVDEQVAFLRVGIDGLFTDQSDIAVLARSIVEATR